MPKAIPIISPSPFHTDGDPEIADFSESGSYADNGELAHWDSRAVKSFFDDAARFVPELKSVIGGILNAPARMDPRPEMVAALRGRAEALVAEYDTPLPEGDAGLIEADRRMRKLLQHSKELYAQFPINLQLEGEIINGIIDPVWHRMMDFIDETPPRSFAGAAVKMRLLTDKELGAFEDKGAATCLRQVAEFIERAA